jgi:hypothetical protein
VYRYSWAFYFGKCFIGLGVATFALAAIVLISERKPFRNASAAGTPTQNTGNDPDTVGGISFTDAANSDILWCLVIVVLFFLVWYVFVLAKAWGVGWRNMVLSLMSLFFSVQVFLAASQHLASSRRAEKVALPGHALPPAFFPVSHRCASRPRPASPTLPNGVTAACADSSWCKPG